MHSPELDWLPDPSPDWGDRLQTVTQGQPADWAELVCLAMFRLDALMTIRLDRRMRRVFVSGPAPETLTVVRLALLGSSTLDHLVPALRVAALRRGIWLEIHVGAFGQYAAELANPEPLRREFRPDTVLLALDAAHLLAGLGPGMEAASAAARLDAICEGVAAHWRLAKAAGWSVIQQTCLPVFSQSFGNNEHRMPGSQAAACLRLNARLRDMADSEGVDLLALDARSAMDGLRAWHDPMLWHRAKQEVHPGAAPVYGDLVARLLDARQGRSRKALVLDLDNTLWGGVIGDDGLEGITIGQGSALGEAFVAFQAYARGLSRRGIILAVCSKNDEANALAPFEHHPEMVLRRSDIACFVANWSDKATNLRLIAQRLNIGLDALVFADDNPAERAIVRRELPMVAVPELPEDPAEYGRCIADAGYFEAVRLTDEDLGRGALYQTNLQRETARAETTDVAGYLRSLEMELRWSRFDRLGAARIVQLINKTNQFNLTTRRTTPDAVAAIIDDPAALSLQLRLVDRFGDNGIIAILHGHRDGPDLVLDTWLMSCRVLGRGAEEATLNVAVAEARRLGADRLVGIYRPTAKNGMVRGHYAGLGFAQLADATGDGETRWALDLSAFQPRPIFMQITEA